MSAGERVGIDIANKKVGILVTAWLADIAAEAWRRLSVRTGNHTSCRRTGRHLATAQLAWGLGVVDVEADDRSTQSGREGGEETPVDEEE